MSEPLFELLGEQQAELLARRHQRAAQAYRDGMQGLVQAKQEAFKNKGRLLDVSQQLNLALRLNRQDPLNYIGMAYFLMLLDELSKAESYAQRALALDPENTKAGRILAGIVKLKKNKPPDSETPSRLAVTPEASLSYSETRAAIFQEVKRVLEVVELPEPAVTPEACAAVIQQRQSLKDLRDLFKTQLKRLAKDDDITELEGLMRPLHALIARFEAALAAGVEFQSLSEAISLAFGQSADLFMALAGPVSAAFANQLEAILDSCDALADRLDALEQQHYDIKALEAEYGNLVSYVRALQDQWELSRPKT